MANILMILQEHYPKDTRVRKEIGALLEDKHNVSIICLQADGELINETTNDVRIYRLGLSKKRASTLRYLFEYASFFFMAYFKVKQLVKNEKFDIVHVHTIPDFLVFAAHPAKRKGARVILDMHEIMPEFFISKYGVSESHLAIRMLRFLERKSIEYADQVITINRQLREKFERRSEPKREIVEIMNTVSDEVLPRLRRESSPKFIAVYHGTLTKLYNLEFAIKAISECANLLHDFEFHIYGTGPESDRLSGLVVQLQLQGKVFLHGMVNYDRIPRILSEASLGILPIKKDIMSDLSFSNKLAEYVHSGIPVLMSDLASVMHYFAADTVFYYRNDDKQDFVRQLMHVYNHPEERNVYAMRAAEAAKEISWDVMKERLQRLVNRTYAPSEVG